MVGGISRDHRIRRVRRVVERTWERRATESPERESSTHDSPHAERHLRTSVGGRPKAAMQRHPRNRNRRGVRRLVRKER